MSCKEPIAIIGIGCRFPGGVNDAPGLWKLLVEGREAVGDVPPDRWNLERFYDAEQGLAGKTFAKRGGFIDGIDQFDPQFFGISPREAPYIDPQHRLLLETAWEAIEDAGLVLDFERGTDLGVFVGISHTDYQVIQGSPWDRSGISQHSPTGTAHSIAANRISYCFNLRGPSIALDTACSSALTAVHIACEHLRAGRCAAALAGGVTVIITPDGFIGFSQAGMLSPDGRCAAFDASANGFVRGEGAGMVMLKPLSRARADGDPIHAVILGSAVNQDGHTNGISLPSTKAQAQLVRDACADAGIDPLQIGYVEAHGTGTTVGDPIEAHALAEALCVERASEAPLLIGSVKTNLGHLESAAGVVGLVKAALVLQRGRIPASLHFTTPNPAIDFAALKLRVPTTIEPFPQLGPVRMAGVNSFGFGGSNAHVILAEPPARKELDSPRHQDVHLDRAWPLVLSARSEEALRGSAGRLSAWLEERAKSNGGSTVLPDLVYTLGARRNHHAYRLAVVAGSMPEAAQEFGAFASGQPGPKLRTSFTPRSGAVPRVGFVMSGQGPQWWGMGRDLMEREHVFRGMIEACDRAMSPWARFSVLEELARPENESRMERTEIAQPAIFAIQMALTELWKSWGVVPAAIVGHSVGEIAAACAAGVLSLDQAAQVIVLRGRHMDECASEGGAMLAVGLGEDEARAVVARHDRTVTTAAFNGPRSITLSGLRSSLEAIAAELETQGVFARFMRVDHAFHSPFMQPAADAVERALAGLAPQLERVPFFSTVTGQRCAGPSCDAGHWARGIRQPVQFVSAVNALAGFGVEVWLEISAHPALAHSIQECLGAQGVEGAVLSSARREREHESVIETAMSLHLAGVPLDFAAMTPSRRLLTLPAYAWDKQRWWNEAGDWRDGRLSPGGRGLLMARLPRATPTWIARLDGRHMAFLKDHRVENHVIFPAAGYVELVLEAGAQLFNGRPFAIEDLEIRKPLIVPDPSSELLLELSYDPGARTFSIHSRFEQGAAWSLHVVGAMRDERTESAFAASTWEAAEEDGLSSVETAGHYQRLAEHGLRYGAEFRPIHDLRIGSHESAGRVSLSAGIRDRAGEYQVHPVIFDGALQICSAGAAAVKDRKPRLRLPVRFGKILFLRSPGAVSLVRASIRQLEEEFLDGSIRLYDEKGRPCVLVDGFHAVSVEGARRSGGVEASHDLLYHVGWERTPAISRPFPLRPVPLARLQETVRNALDEVIALRGRAALEGMSATLEEELAAAQVARGLRAIGVARAMFTPDSLGVAASMRQAFGCLVSGLVERGLLVADHDGQSPTAAFADAAESAPEMLRSFISRHPGHLPEALLCAATCAELGPILRGEKDAVQVLFSGGGTELLDQFYGDGFSASHWLAAIGRAVEEAARQLPEGRGLRILEVGAGTGGLTSHVLPMIERGLHTYVLTDLSAAFFGGTMQKLASFPEVECKVFDLEKPPADQGFEAGSFDLILGTNVLHAVADVRVTLRHLHELLAPGGTLIFMDTATASLWAVSVFGLTSGWWRFTDRDLRPLQPLLDRAQWEDVLRQSGFSETASVPGLRAPNGGDSQIALLARKAWIEERAQADEPVAATPAEASWIVLADTAGLGEQLAGHLRSAGVRCRIAWRGGCFADAGADAFTLRAEAPEDWKSMFDAIGNDAPPDRVVYLWNLDEPEPGGEGDWPLMATDGLLHLAQVIDAARPAAKLRLDVVTRGAQPVGRDMVAPAVAQAPAIGLMRVILSEHPNFACRGIDLPPNASDADVALLWSELLRTDAEREVAFRGEARYVQRLVRGLAPREELLDRSEPLRLESREKGLLDALRFTPFTVPVCAPGEVLIAVKAAALNFRDVLKALGLYPSETPDGRAFGDDVAGVVAAVGAGVRHVKPGDEVFGITTSGLATHAMSRAGDVRTIPAGLSFEAAATIPVVSMTAWHALHQVARLRSGERVLVHAGAGGVGMAAIQIAQHLGAEVIATAGSPAKRGLLEILGVKHVIDSRRADFVDAIMDITGGRGVDVILNSLAAEAIPMGLSCLAPFGRFIEIGKRDVYQNSRIPLWPLRANASFHVVAMDTVFNGDAELTRSRLETIAGLVEQGALHALPFRSFPACRVDAAFRLMAQGKHTGKVVVAFPEAFMNRRAQPSVPAFTIRQDGSYLITGAFGGFGRVLARWLVDGGARHLVLASRGGPATPEAAAFVESLRARGVQVRVERVDVGSRADVARLTANILASDHPLVGVFHLAMVIDDAPLGELNRERMRRVIVPKARGAWLLHEATCAVGLDCFVMFSSVSSVLGNAAQGNYAAANAFLDSLAHHRRALGLPALVVNWGALGGEGYVARNERVAEFLARQGTTALSPVEVTGLLESLLSSGVTQAMAIRLDWSKWRQVVTGFSQSPLLEHILVAGVEGQESSGVTGDWRRKIESAPDDERGELIGRAVREIVGSVLRVKPASLRADQPLTDLGLDSLMAVETENLIESTLGVALPPSSLMRARTIGQIGALLIEHMGGAGPSVAPPVSVPAAQPVAAVDGVGLEVLSDADIDLLLDEEAAIPVVEAPGEGRG